MNTYFVCTFILIHLNSLNNLNIEGNAIDNRDNFKNYIFNFVESRFYLLKILIGLSNFKFYFIFIFELKK